MASNAVFASSEQVGKVEDVSDIITNISPTKTPFQSMIGSESIHNTLHQWQEDQLASAVTTNKQKEGADAIAAVQNPTVLRTNSTQIFMKTAKVTGTADRVKTYGRAKELAYQLTLRSAEIKRDREATFTGAAQAAAPAVDVTTAGAMANAETMIALANQFAMGTTGGLGIAASAAGDAVALSEAAVLAVAQELYTQGADPDTLMIKPGDSLKVAAWQQGGSVARTTFVENGQRDIVNVVDFYQSPFGRLKVVMNRFQDTSVAFVFEASMWKTLVLRNWFRETLAKTGDSTNVMLVGEFSLKHRNFQASGMVTNLA